MNLDGKIDHDALEYLKHNHVDEYIDAEKIVVLVDWKTAISRYLPEQYILNSWKPCQKEIPDERSVCLIRSDNNQKVNGKGN